VHLGHLSARARVLLGAGRRRAAEAKLVVVNHALLARASDAEGILPPFDALIVDEAHRLEGVLSSQLERAVSRHRIDELLRLTGSASGGRRGGAGLLGRVRSFALPLLDSGSPTRERLHGDLDRLSERAELLRNDAEQLFARIAFGGDGAPAASPYSRRVRHQSSEQLLGRDLQTLDVVLEHARHYGDVLRRAAGVLGLVEGRGEAGDALQAELETVGARSAGAA
jgi:Rad3-related DNA helicase